jgi:uncharacterized membrane protein YphA (DoxX/SURF4 family)
MAELRLLDVDHESDGPDWVIRIAIAIMLGIAGSEKFSNAPYSSWVKMFNQIGWGDWFRYFTGVVELTGAALVLIPHTVTIGLALLACTMAGAAITHVAILRDGAVAAVPAVIALGLVGFAVLRRKMQ